MKAIGLFLLIAAIVLKGIWDWYPGMTFCLLFWATSLWSSILIGPKQWFCIPGTICNAAATISNGGYMPTMDDGAPYTGIYVPLTPDSALPWLCDRFYGGSVGDILLLFGLLILFGLFFGGRFNSKRRGASV